MMKKILYLAACLLLMAACSKPDDPKKPGGDDTPASVVGCWELSDVATKASVGSVNVRVFIQFSADDTFLLYQKIGEGRFTVFSGTFKYLDGKLSGTYSNNASWGPYGASVTASKLTLTTAGGKEVDTYVKIASIPSSVTDNVY